jgi:CheY-like chemotaxis protein
MEKSNNFISHHAERSKPTANILLVDDEIISQEIGKRIFKSLGYQVDTTSSGVEALALCQDRSFNYVLIDYYLPDIQGDQLARRIRSLATNSDVYIIGMSNDPSSLYRNACVQAGMNEVIEKPLTQSLIKDIVVRNAAVLS